MAYNDHIPTSELERILGTTEVSLPERVRYNLSFLHWQAKYTLGAFTLMFGANGLIFGDYSFSSALYCLAASAVSIKIGDMTSGDFLMRTDKADAVNSVIDLRLETRLYESYKPLQYFIDEVKVGDSYSDISLIDFMNTGSEIFQPDYLLLGFNSSNNGDLMCIADKDLSFYLDKFLENEYLERPSDESLYALLQEISSYDFLKEIDSKFQPCDGFDIVILGACDSSYIGEGQPLSFISVDDLEACEQEFIEESELATRNFDKMLNEPWYEYK